MQIEMSFPQPLSEKYRPKRIAEFVGLEKPKRIISKLAVNPYPSAWLFVGPSGTGKTTMALSLAAEMPAELQQGNRQPGEAEFPANRKGFLQQRAGCPDVPGSRDHGSSVGRNGNPHTVCP